MTDSPRDPTDAPRDRPGPADDSDVRADVRPEAAGMGTVMDLSALDDAADLKDLAPVAADRGGPDEDAADPDAADPDAADPDAPSIDDFDLSSGRGTDHHVDVPPEPPPRPAPPANRPRGTESEDQVRERLKRELKAEVLAEMRAERHAGRRGEAAGGEAEEASLDDFTVLTGADGDGDGVGFSLSGEIPVAPQTLPPAAPVPPPARPPSAAPAPSAPPADQGGPPPVKLPPPPAKTPPTKTPPTADAPAPSPAAERSAPAPSAPQPAESEPPDSEPRAPEPPKPAPYTPPKPPPQSSYKPPTAKASRRAGKSSGGGGVSLSIPEPLKDPKVLGGIAVAAAAAYFFLFAGGGFGTGQDQLRDLDALYAKYATGADVAAEQKALVAEIEPTTRGARQGDPRREAYTLARQFGRLLDDKAKGLSGPQLEEKERKFKDRLDLWKGKLGMTP